MKTFFLSILAVVLICLDGRSADARPDYLKSFDPAIGFKRLEPNLTDIFLQLAGSIECYGTPEPYFRFVMAEEGRLEAKFKQQTGQEMQSLLPSYMTTNYVSNLSQSWKRLAAKSELTEFYKLMGHVARLGILGTRDKGTIVVDILNENQNLCVQSLRSDEKRNFAFEMLRSNLVDRLELSKTNVDEENYEISRRDAVSFGFAIKGYTAKFGRGLDNNLPADDAKRGRDLILQTYGDLARMAQTQLSLAFIEQGLDRQRASHN